MGQEWGGADWIRDTWFHVLSTARNSYVLVLAKEKHNQQTSPKTTTLKIWYNLEMTKMSKAQVYLKSFD